MIVKIITPLLVLILLPSAMANVCQPVNYEVHNQFGPFDFYSAKSHEKGAGGRQSETNITIVTNYHLTQDIISLKRGRTGGHLNKDLDYTLRALPNHPQALDTASRFEKRRAEQPMYAKKQSALPNSADCYFERAFKVFGNQQPQTWMLWGLHKYRQQDYQTAINYYNKAVELGLSGAEINYNLGLAYFRAEQYGKAKQHADIAYELGYSLPGLKNLLNSVTK